MPSKLLGVATGVETDKAQTWTQAQRFTTNTLLTFGTTDGTDGDFSYDGTNMVVTVNSGNLTLNPAGVLVSQKPLRFDTGVAVTAAQYEIARNADGTNRLQLNVPTGVSFELSANDVEVLRVDSTGHVEATGTASLFRPVLYSASATADVGMGVQRARGTLASPTAVQSGDYIASFMGDGYGTTFARAASMIYVAAQTWTATAQGSEIRFYNKPNDTITHTLRWTILNTGEFQANGAQTISSTAGLTLSSTAANMLLNTSSAGVARSITYDITVGAGGAANAVLQHAFHLDSVIEAGLLGETDGSGTYTQLKTVWKIPYADAGAGTIGPTAPTTAATWNGGLFLGASNAVANGRLYWNANEALHYVDATAGFSFLYKEPTTFGDFNNWKYGDMMVLKVDRYTEDGGHALPYPLEDGVRAAMLRLLDEDPKFRQLVKERLHA